MTPSLSLSGGFQPPWSKNRRPTGAPAPPVRRVEGLVVLGPGAEGAELVRVGALRGRRCDAQRERGPQRDEAMHRQAPLPHGSWCSSRRRFCARPAALVLVATGLEGP